MGPSFPTCPNCKEPAITGLERITKEIEIEKGFFVTAEYKTLCCRYCADKKAKELGL